MMKFVWLYHSQPQHCLLQVVRRRKKEGREDGRGDGREGWREGGRGEERRGGREGGGEGMKDVGRIEGIM